VVGVPRVMEGIPHGLGMLQTPVLEAGSKPAYGNEAETACREELATEMPTIRSLGTKCRCWGKGVS
jgi:hypothetical protein